MQIPVPQLFTDILNKGKSADDTSKCFPDDEHTETDKPHDDDTTDPDLVSNYALDISSCFYLPVSYIEDKQILQDNVIEDLEMIDPMDPSMNSIYDMTFMPTTEAGRCVVREIPKYYSTDTDYLRDTQELLKVYSSNSSGVFTEENGTSVIHSDLLEVIQIWKEMKSDTGFKNKYHYIDWSYWEHLNNSESVLQFISMYSLASPVLSLIVPFIILIMPFFIIKAKGMDVTMAEYTQVLKLVASNHALCKIFTSFTSVSMDQKVYLLASTALYVFSIYQNLLACTRFYRNMKKMHRNLLVIRTYINKTIAHMTTFLSHTESLRTYSPFNQDVKANLTKLVAFKERLDLIQGDDLGVRNTWQIGKLMKYFYEMYDDSDCTNMFLYSFGYHGYVETINGLSVNITAKNLGMATFNTKKKTTFKKAYYGALLKTSRVTNNIKLDKNMIITGPNASGKTTTLKTALLNVILSQQYGCGYYTSCNINPFNHIHCYLNIPDTSGRDSLFQAEARRCKDIIDVVLQHKKQRHFCVFDELYSGTNPDEAVSSAIAFMKYLIKHKGVKCILTTHFIAVCKNLDSERQVRNCHMETKTNDTSFSYKYVLKKGISEVRGGIKVLSDMEYPEEILNNTTAMH